MLNNKTYSRFCILRFSYSTYLFKREVKRDEEIKVENVADKV